MNKLIDMFNDIFSGGGLFSLLPENVQPWLSGSEETKTADKLALDMQYLGNHSGSKYTSPFLVRLFKDVENPKITSSNINQIAGVIKVMYLDKWSKLWDALTADYDPIENYNMYEKRTPDLVNETDTKTDTKMTTTDTDKSEVVTENGTYAYNSSELSPSDKTVVSTDPEDNVRTTVNEGDSDHNKTNSKTTYKGKEETERHGNIGVTTTQQMITQELELRKYIYFKEIFEDVDKVLTIDIY